MFSLVSVVLLAVGVQAVTDSRHLLCWRKCTDYIGLEPCGQIGGVWCKLGSNICQNLYVNIWTGEHCHHKLDLQRKMNGQPHHDGCDDYISGWRPVDCEEEGSTSTTTAQSSTTTQSFRTSTQTTTTVTGAATTTTAQSQTTPSTTSTQSDTSTTTSETSISSSTVPTTSSTATATTSATTTWTATTVAGTATSTTSTTTSATTTTTTTQSSTTTATTIAAIVGVHGQYCAHIIGGTVFVHLEFGAEKVDISAPGIGININDVDYRFDSVTGQVVMDPDDLVYEGIRISVNLQLVGDSLVGDILGFDATFSKGSSCIL